MKNILFTKSLLCVIFSLLFFTACEDNMKEHYKVPSWLKGSAWEILESEGNYSIFLEGAELAGFRPIMEGKAIVTVMAPNDKAFSTYLSEHNYSNVSDISVAELKKLIGFHLLYYSFAKDRLINFRPEGDLATDEDKLINAGGYYKQRTYSSSETTIDIDPNSGKHLTVYHLDRYIPIFSYLFFESKGIDAKSNYEYFYPNSSWTGVDGFNVSNSTIKEYSLLADNGYIYIIDKVLEPLETIYNEINSNENYSHFISLFDSYTTYEYDNTLSTDYGKALGVDSLYRHTHGNLPPIAQEWPVSSYTDVKSLTSKAYTLFAPNNNSLDKFFEEFFQKGEYESMEDIDPLVMQHLLNQFVYYDGIVFPEEITSGKIKNKYGMLFNFDPTKVTDKAICVNGAFYGLSEFSTPLLFSSVVGPVFRDKNKAPYLYALDNSNLLQSYASPNMKSTLLIPTETQMNGAGIYLKSYTTGNVLQEETLDGWANVSTTVLQNIINLHTVETGDGFIKSGTKVYYTQKAFNYLYVNNGKITCSSKFNILLNPENISDPFVPFKEITNNNTPWNNGKVYTYEESPELFETESSDGVMYTLASCNDKRYPYYAFVQLMKKAGLVEGTQILGLLGTKFIAFIPTNEAVKSALVNNTILGLKNASFNDSGHLVVLDSDVDKQLLKDYLYSYFISAKKNVINSYPFIGSIMNSQSYITESTVNPTLNYNDSGTDLSIQLGSNAKAHVISDYHYFPFAYNDGCFHLIDAAL